VAAALKAELLLPLRSLVEGQRSMHHTYNGEPVPADAVAETVQALVASVVGLPNSYAAWRYGCPAGVEQLRGLDGRQVELWRTPTAFNHAGLRTHEDADGELGLFWATKIGGPSHGFDFEGQCLLPLLANARSKVILVSDPAWPAYPSGRAHFKLLWAAPAAGEAPEPRLWLEALNADFDAAEVVDADGWQAAVLSHAMAKADAMSVPLSVSFSLAGELHAAASSGSTVRKTQEQILLRPSNGVCEASDYLSARHDWVQLDEEVVQPPHPRALYIPAAAATAAAWAGAGAT